MRKSLLVALILYNLIYGGQSSYDYEEQEAKRFEGGRDARRNWRRRALTKPGFDRQWGFPGSNPRRDYETDHTRYAPQEAYDKNNREMPYMNFGGHEEYDKRMFGKSAEYLPPKEHSPPTQNFREKEPPKKTTINCDRERERFENCFAGCSSVTCDNPKDRLRPCYPFCEPGCICVPPYVRDDRTHKCVHPDECTKGLKGIPDLTDIEE